MTERGLLIVFSGPSGVGKDTLLTHLLERRPDCTVSVSATTRQPRPGEVEGRDYYFITREKFGELVACGKMLEYAQYSDNFYGTPADEVERKRNQGCHVILEIEVQGAMQVKEHCPDAVFIFLMPPSMEALRQRLEKRGTESPEAVEQRILAAREEIAQADAYDYLIVNNTIDESCAQLDAVITAASCDAKRMMQLLKKENDNA